MNKKLFKKNIGKPFKLRPDVVRIASDGRRLQSRNDDWYIEKIDNNFVEFSNPATGHRFSLGIDNIREFRTPNYLLLRCHIIACGRKIIVEPYSRCK